MPIPEKKEFQFQAEMGQLLHLLAHSLYTEQDIFLRELISNASDALKKLNFKALTDSSILGEETELKIRIDIDEKEKIISLSDNGLGMTEEDLINNIGTVAHSGTSGFLQQLTGDSKKDAELIGRFGVGFYAVFMVTDFVTLETRHYGEEQGFKWTSEGKGSFSIEPIKKDERGTKISFRLKKDAEDLANTWKVESIIKKYSDFVSFPIEVNGEQKNKSVALWSRNKKEVAKDEYIEFFKYISHSGKEPLHHLHFNIEAPVQFNAVLFIPSEKNENLLHRQLETKINLYAKKVFIQDDCKDLLPRWLRFIHGVVDSQDLPLNVSREITQKSPAMQKIKDFLTKKILAEFKKWANKDKEKFENFWQLFGNIIKEGLHDDFENREKLLDLYHTYSSKSPEKIISLQEYVERMSVDQKEIYYLYGKTQSIIESSPNLEYFIKNDIEVLYLYEEIDDFIFPSIGEYKEKPIIDVNKAEPDIADSSPKEKEDTEKIDETAKEKLLQYFKDILGDRVSEVVASKRLIDSPCTLVAPKDGMNAHMEKMMSMMNSEFTASKKVFEVNLNNSIIKNLAQIREKFPQDQLVKDAIEQLYENAALLEGALEDPSKMSSRTLAFLNKVSEFHLNSLA